MTSLKEVDENIIIAGRWAVSLQAWASTSFARFLLILLLLGIAIFGIEYIYLNRLLAKDTTETRAHIQEVTLLGKELEYKTTIAAITSCLDSGNDSQKTHVWYCNQAAMQYRRAAQKRPQARIDEVVGLLAYRAMRDDVSGYLDGLKLQRLSNAPASSAQTTLKTALSKTAVFFFLSLVLALLVGTYLFLWVLPQHRKAQSVARQPSPAAALPALQTSSGSRGVISWTIATCLITGFAIGRLSNHSSKRTREKPRAA